MFLEGVDIQDSLENLGTPVSVDYRGILVSLPPAPERADILVTRVKADIAGFLVELDQTD